MDLRWSHCLFLSLDTPFFCRHLFRLPYWIKTSSFRKYFKVNLEPNYAGLKGSRTTGVWHKSLEESHAVLIKERSLPGHIMCSEETPKKILGSDIFCILESEGVREIGALYKVSPSKYVLVFESITANEKLSGSEIQFRFVDSKIYLNFRKTT